VAIRSLRLLPVFVELDRQAVDAIAHSGVSGSVWKYVTQMPPAFFAKDFGSDHAVAGVAGFFYRCLARRAIKAGPPTAGIKLGVRLKKGLSAASATIRAFSLGIPVLTGKGALGAFLAQYVVLLRRQLFLPVSIVVLLVSH
jgi:hypothetical protein